MLMVGLTKLVEVLKKGKLRLFILESISMEGYSSLRVEVE